LAWTRARVLTGSRPLASRIESAVEAFVYGPWSQTLPGFMNGIRARMENELAKEHEGRLDLKVGRGGLADIDFLLELIQIREGWTRPEFRVAGTRRLLASMPPTSYLSAEDIHRLREAYRFLRTLETLARMDGDSNISWVASDPEALNALGTRMGLAD